MVGRQRVRYVLPTGINQQASLLYHHIIGTPSERFDFRNFCCKVFMDISPLT